MTQASGEPEAPEPGTPGADPESVFEKVADYVSAAMGRPTNIMVWLVLVVAWTALFASGLVNPAAWTALERKGLIKSFFPQGALLTPAGLAYETGLAEQILHRHSHH